MNLRLRTPDLAECKPANYEVLSEATSFTFIDVAGSDGLTIRSFFLDDGSSQGMSAKP